MLPIPPSYLFRDLPEPWGDPAASVQAVEPPSGTGRCRRWGDALARLGGRLTEVLAAGRGPGRLATGRP